MIKKIKKTKIKFDINIKFSLTFQDLCIKIIKKKLPNQIINKVNAKG